MKRSWGFRTKLPDSVSAPEPMLVLQFRTGQDLFGLDGGIIIEVAPLTALRKLPHAEVYVAGLFNYRGRLVPTVDLSALLTGVQSRPLLSTRIVVVNYTPGLGQGRVLGLIAEGVTEVHRLEETELQDPGIAVADAPYLGKVWVNEGRSLQLIDLNKVLPEALRASLFSHAESAV